MFSNHFYFQPNSISSRVHWAASPSPFAYVAPIDADLFVSFEEMKKEKNITKNNLNLSNLFKTHLFSRP